MTIHYLTDFLTLRAAGNIGRIWPPDNTRAEGRQGWLLAPDDALPMMEYRMAETITEEKLMWEIDKRMGRDVGMVVRKPVQSVHMTALQTYRRAC